MKKILYFLAIMLLTLSCKHDIPTYNFLDIESGKIKLVNNEKKIIQDFISKHKIKKEEFYVNVNNNGYGDINITNEHIDKINFTKIKIEDMSFVRNFKYLKSIQLNNCEINKIEGIKDLTKLSELLLINNKISNTLIVKDLTNITSLVLDYNKIDSLYIYNCTNLNYISCNDNRLSYFYLKNLGTSPTVILRNNKITNFDIINSKLYLLDISENNITELPENFNEENVSKLILNSNNKKVSVEEIANDILQKTDSAEKARGVFYISKEISHVSKKGKNFYSSRSDKGLTADMQYLTGATKEKFTSTNGSRQVKIKLSVKKGKVTIYLKGEKDKGTYKCITVSENKPDSLYGLAFQDVGMYNYYFFLEANDNKAEGIKYTIEY